MVRIVAPQGYFSACDDIRLIIGKAGTIKRLHHEVGPHGPYWDVKLADGAAVWVAQSCMRLIPGDTDGRQLVRWDQCDWSPSRSLVEA